MLMQKTTKIFLIFFVFCNSLFSQMFSIPKQRQQPVIIWGENYLAIIEKFGTVVKFGDLTHGGFYREFLPRPNTLGVSTTNNYIVDVRLINDKFYSGKLSTKGSIEEELEIEMGRDPEQRGFPTRLYETDQPDLYFAINVDTGFIKNKEASCCSWWRRTESRSLRLDKIIPIKWIDEPALLPIQNNGKPVYAAFSKAVPGLFPFLDAPIRVPGAFIVVSWKAGVLWVIKDGSSTPNKVIDLIGIDKNFVTGMHPFPCVILGIQPLQNGKILVARRSYSAIHESYKLFNIEMKNPNPQPIEYRVNDTEQHIATIVFPEIEWVEVAPLSGEISKPDTSLIASAPVLLKSVDDIAQFTFGFDPGGRLVIPWTSPQIEKMKSLEKPLPTDTPKPLISKHK